MLFRVSQKTNIVSDFLSCYFPATLNVRLTVVPTKIGLYFFYSDLFITEGYKVDNQIFQIKRKSFCGYYKTSTSRLQELCRSCTGGGNTAGAHRNSRALTVVENRIL